MSFYYLQLNITHILREDKFPLMPLLCRNWCPGGVKILTRPFTSSSTNTHIIQASHLYKFEGDSRYVLDPADDPAVIRIPWPLATVHVTMCVCIHKNKPSGQIEDRWTSPRAYPNLTVTNN